MYKIKCHIDENIFNPSNYTILVIEDSKSMNKILTTTMIKCGYKCFNAFTLQDGKNILIKEKIDYIILDIHLPDGNGYELIKQYEHAPQKIFVLTTEADKQVRDISFQRGVIDFMVKDRNFLHNISQISQTIQQLEDNKNKTILIIDDSIIIQEQLKDIFQNRNYNIQVASNATQAMEVIQTNNIDLIILDVNLGKENGIEFLQKNKTEVVIKKDIPVMILSGIIDTSLIRDAIKAGAIDILSKPFILEEIILKVDMWIDYKRQKDEISKSSQILNEYKDTVDEGCIVSKTNVNGIITYVNDKFCELSGFSQKELIGKNHNIVRHPDTPKEVFKELWETIKKEKKTWHGKVKNLKKDGGYYWVDAYIKPILNKQGEITEFIGLRVDITDQEDVKEYFKHKLDGSQKDLEKSIKLAKEYEKAINESNILSRSDINGKITYVNDKFIQETGYSKEDVLGKSHNILSHPDTPKEIYKELWHTIKNGNVFNNIIKNKRKDGSAYWVDTTVVPIFDDHNNIIEYMAIRHDITDLFTLHKEIEETQKEIVYKMGEIGETRSKETGNHVKRVAYYSKLLAQLYGLSEEDVNNLFTASPMHDIGKVGIPDEILKKPGKLTNSEFNLMKTHSIIGEKILQNSNRAILQAAQIVAYQHHEKWDGSGYPQGLKGEDIHIYGRITAIADVFDALGSDRCYKKAWEDERIFQLFEDEKGKHFDPILVDLFLDNKEQFMKIRDRYQDDEIYYTE